jgi:hypothetical protein
MPTLFHWDTHGQHAYFISLGHTRTACILSFVGTHTDSMHTLFRWDAHGQHAYFLSLGHTRTACLLSFIGTHTDSMSAFFHWDTHGQHAYFISLGHTRTACLLSFGGTHTDNMLAVFPLQGKACVSPSPNTVRISDAAQTSEWTSCHRRSSTCHTIKTYCLVWAGWFSGNAVDLYSGGVRIKSQPGHRLSCFHVPPQSLQENAEILLP